MKANFFYNIFLNHPKFFIILFFIIFISLVDNIVISYIKYKDQKKFMKDLYLERQRYEMIIEELDEIIFDYNVAEKKTITSSQFKKIFGQSVNFINNSLVHDDDKNILNQVLETSQKNKSELYIEKIRLQNKDKAFMWFSIKIKYIYQDKKLVRIIGKIIDINDSVNKYNKLKQKSQHDLLTQVYNKIAFFKHVQNYIKENRNSKFALIFIDLDNFKLVNDNLGHLQGDKLLKETAEKLSNIFNANDAIARFGGDEFCIFSPNMSLIKDKINKINSELKVLYSCNTNHIVVSASIGIAFYPNDGNNINSLLKKSDIALYNSKKNGKNQVTIYNDSLAE